MTADLHLRIGWLELGPVALVGGALRFPQADQVPGIYRFTFATEDGQAEYIGEATSLRNRFVAYAGAVGRLSTDTRMRNRMTRVLDEGGAVDVAIGQPSLAVAGVDSPVDLSNKLVRVFIEHGAVTEALSRGRPVLNGPGYPPAAPGTALTGSPASAEPAHEVGPGQ